MYIMYICVYCIIHVSVYVLIYNKEIKLKWILLLLLQQKRIKYMGIDLTCVKVYSEKL